MLLAAILGRLDGGSRLHPELLDLLVRHRYMHHFRELEQLVRLAKRTSPDGTLGVTPELLAVLDVADAGAPLPSEVEIREALASAPSAALAAKRLGLPSRFALYRLMRKLGIEA